MSERLIELYLPAGVATSPMFMERLRQVVERGIEETGAIVRSSLSFPYGDNERSLFGQLREVGRDLRLRDRRLDGSLGGNRLLGMIDESRRALRGDFMPARTIIVGHSAGGVAAVHAARLLYARDGGLPPLVVMIGSPRCRIPDELREQVLYVYAARSDSQGAGWISAKLLDPITRLGSFGGWHTGRWRLPRWQMDKHAPVHASGLRIVGGHADYFREQHPYVNARGLSNMAVTAEAVIKWLKQRL
ncbi:hypothetical protein [Cohnella panacarvi]|uniref:hypothetical protein n=1 Tax=Cohnella panacarvi TaxID=400776 RepID=UPI00047E7B1A|nr:hypothetical protein [Cohnella panacarvi]